ncbi:GAF domain-containing protein [Methylocystis sp. H62]|uniref:ATP-binding protein n=1 Tax=Methylocystis sp. H62 TaxID=2785789 RepID=UPI0018C1F68C|nr:ATP-binding protein [Methylocystis sp. H62]MBG0794254.1 GAF domain-containing protein [Methylocystis sp. H62]
MSDIITAKNVDLSNCDREQVQFSGAVQPHGCLLVVEEASLAILQASVNTGDLIGIAPDTLRRGTVEAVLGARTAEITARLKSESLDNGPVHLACLIAEQQRMKRPLNLFAHRAGGVLILEFEVVPEAAERPMLELYSQLRATISRLQTTQSLQAFFDEAVAKIRHFTGFERVMAYKFLEDGSGHVMAESNAEGFSPYLGLHYPATDIPAPARRLFAMAWLRHLPNVDYQPAPLAPEAHPRTGDPVDLSYAFLRSVSVMYSGYLKNMGVKSTMVMPLMKDGKLWGLISCMHESAPRHVPYEARMAAEFLAHMLSLMMAAKEDAESYAYRLRMKTVLDSMMQTLHERSDLHAGLGGGNGRASIAAYIEADGAALVTEDRVTCLGATPAESDIRELSAWLLANSEELITATDRLPGRYPLAAKLASSAAGLLAVRLSKRRPEHVMWFRVEQAQTVAWAGDPNKPVEVDTSDGTIRLMPRTSFAIWKDSVAGRSRPWGDFEVKAAADLRWAIVEVILERAEETELLNRELRDVNIELDSFAYIASHDLKEPLRGIHHMATFLKRGHGDAAEQTQTILRLTKRMDDLIESLLQYSRTGRADMALVDCDLDTVLDETLLGLKLRISEAGCVIRRPAKLPTVKADRIRLREALSNLIGNAINYNDKSERWVEIGVEPAAGGGPPVIYVRDNGIGIAERYHERIFQIFRRLHTRDEFGGGSGAGLTIAKKTIERHGGRIWLASTPDVGTTFFFTLQPAAQGAQL